MVFRQGAVHLVQPRHVSGPDIENFSVQYDLFLFMVFLGTCLIISVCFLIFSRCMLPPFQIHERMVWQHFDIILYAFGPVVRRGLGSVVGSTTHRYFVRFTPI
jgi:hypothetical protein